MKKNYYKVSSFFTEKRSTIIIILFILCVLFIPKNTYALNKNDFNTQTFSNELSSILERYFKFDNFIYFYNNVNTWYIVPVVNNQGYCLNDNGNSTYTLKYIKEDNTQVSTRLFNTNVDLLNISYSTIYTPALNEIFSNYSSTNKTGGLSNFNSTFDLPSCSDLTTTLFTANKTYSPPSSEECENGGGPVEVSNFPLDKTDFYTLLVLLGVLIIMIFFKWCFPMKGGKKQ